jgi:hypothetical protein
MYDPADPWMVFTHNDSPQPYDGTPVAELPLGLYLVKTMDITVLRGDGVYTRRLLQYAERQRDVDFSIVAMAVATGSPMPRETFRPAIHAAMAVTGPRDDLPEDWTGPRKILRNMLWGLLASADVKHYTWHAVSDGVDEFQDWAARNDVWSGVGRMAGFHNLGKDLFVYGLAEKTGRMAHNLPMAWQLQDDVQMRLLEMVHDVDGVPLMYQTDGAIVLDPTAPAAQPRRRMAIDTEAPWAGVEEVLGPVDAAVKAEVHAALRPWGGYKEALDATGLPKLPAHLPGTYYRSGVPVEDAEQMPRDVMPWTLHEGITDSAQREEIKALLDATGGVCVRGGPGVGKSFFAEWLRKQYPGNGRVVMVAPTHRAAANLKGRTIHAFVGGNGADQQMGRPGLLRQLAACDVVVVDEASMLTEYLMRSLLTLKRAKPSLKVVVMGDWDQLKGVEQLAVPCDYSQHASLKEICACNLVVLTKQYRTDDPKQIEVLDRIRCGEQADMTDYYNISEGSSCERGVAWSNYAVELVNALHMMAQKPSDALHIPEDAASGAPEAWLYVGLPVAGAQTMKLRQEDDVPPAETEEDAERRRWRLYNQQTGVVTAVDADARTFTVKYDYHKDFHFGREFTWSVDEFSACFTVAYCITVHKAQGQTWDEAYAIYEWERMNRRLLYTATSRATHSRHVHLGTLPEADHTTQRRNWQLDNAIRARLAAYRASDKKEGRPVCDLEPADVRSMLDACGNACPTCGCRMALFKSAKDARDLWVLDRRNWKTGGHTRDNVVVKCQACNDTHDHEEAE